MNIFSRTLPTPYDLMKHQSQDRGASHTYLFSYNHSCLHVFNDWIQPEYIAL